jgi:isoaspartyl peptidase/L-asparaginase-like protein (Ntn-hydrolase superfamily)
MAVPSPTVVASERGEVGFPAALAVLGAGGSALDAVHACVRVVEANTADHFVGVGGLPNLVGVVELDALLMEGTGRRVGAVAALVDVPYPSDVARAVLDRLPQHVLLVGEGASRFADECGIARGTVLTDEARELWRQGLSAQGLEEAALRGPGDVRYRQDALARITAMDPPPFPYGTVNVLALDAAGRLAIGISTSGYPWKYPGRVGDSAVVGAGGYADDRVGAAGCTGRGELTVRAGTARTVLDGVRAGLEPETACVAALSELADLPDDYRAPVQTLCLLPDGRHGAAGTHPGSTYAVQTVEETGPQILPRASLDAGPAHDRSY